MSSEQYRDYQRTRDHEYAAAWEKLSPRERERLAKAGIDGPELPIYRTGKPDEEKFIERIAAHSSKASEDTKAEAPPPTDPEDTWAALRRLIAELVADPNPALSLDCLTLVSGIGFLGESMTDIARRHKVTRAAVSKRCVQWTRRLNLLPSRAMRSLTARQSYHVAQKRIREHQERFNSRRPAREAN